MMFKYLQAELRAGVGIKARVDQSYIILGTREGSDKVAKTVRLELIGHPREKRREQWEQ